MSPPARAAGAVPPFPPGIGFAIDVRSVGAVGDGKAIDTPAVNRAIDLAAAMGGGTVRIPPGTYACHSIRLKDSIALYLEPGAVILAAEAPHDGIATGGPMPRNTISRSSNFRISATITGTTA